MKNSAHRARLFFNNRFRLANSTLTDIMDNTRKKKMRKKKTSKKLEFSFKNMQETKIAHKENITTWKPESSFTDLSVVGPALLQCLIDNDTETYMEILESYLRMNKLQVAKKAKMPRSRYN
jgi:hypothetical protein